MSRVQVSAKKVGKEVKVSFGRDYRIELGTDGYPSNRPFKVGQVVLDDLTGELTEVLDVRPIEDIKYLDGSVAVHEAWKGTWIVVKSRAKPNEDGSIWDNGLRYEWEVNHVEKISAHGK